VPHNNSACSATTTTVPAPQKDWPLVATQQEDTQDEWITKEEIPASQESPRSPVEDNASAPLAHAAMSKLENEFSKQKCGEWQCFPSEDFGRS